MNIEIFTEGSDTTADLADCKLIREYFQGGFLTVSSMADSLEEFGEVKLHILSSDLGYVLGSEECENHTSLTSHRHFDPDLEHEKMRDSLSQAAESSDVIVILLTSAKFHKVVSPIWRDIIKNTRPDIIWCLCASRNALDSVELEDVKNKSRDLITYQRVGVARIDESTRDDLVRRVGKLAN